MGAAGGAANRLDTNGRDMASMLAVVASQPVGRMVQRYLTTSADLADTEITGIKRSGRGGARFHKVQTARRPAAAAAA